MTATGVHGLTYDDLCAMPLDDGVRRELVDGELYVSPSPNLRHQHAVGAVYRALHDHAEATGGLALVSPTDVVLTAGTVLVPDVVFFAADARDRLNPRNVGPPTVAVEVSSPSTRRFDLLRKRGVFESFGVNEFWFVDLDEDAVLVHALVDGVYEVRRVEAGELLASRVLPGLRIDVAALVVDPLA